MAVSPGPHKPKRKNKTTGPLVITSLTSALPVALPIALSDTTVQAMPPQIKKSDKMRLKDLLRPVSPRGWKKSESDDSPTSPDPHRWSSPLRRRKKKKPHPSGAHSEGDSPKSDQEADTEDFPAPSELVATQILSLPGQSGEREPRSVGEIPTILVSPEDAEEHSLMRKTSQTSHLSACSSSGDRPSEHHMGLAVPAWLHVLILRGPPMMNVCVGGSDSCHHHCLGFYPQDLEAFSLLVATKRECRTRNPFFPLSPWVVPLEVQEKTWERTSSPPHQPIPMGRPTTSKRTSLPAALLMCKL